MAMKKWWCQRCFLPCDECREDYQRILGSDQDEVGELKVKTVDLRRKKEDNITEWPERPSKETTRMLCREMLKTTKLYDYFQRRRLQGR